MAHLSLVLVPLLLTAACAGDPTPTRAAPPTSAPISAPTSSAPAGSVPTAQDLVGDDVATLSGVRVERAGPATTVTSLWNVPLGRDRRQYVLARSEDGFATGTYTRVSQARGIRSVAPRLTDGRLVAALTAFSDDGRDAPAPRSHGLWVSEGDDWSSMTPYEPRFVPPLPVTDGYGPIVSVELSVDPDPVVLVTLEDGRVYGSPDGVRAFREIAVR
jgi:hypothetical protein